MKYAVPFRKTPLVLAIAATLASPTFVQAAPGDPLGTEFRVNTYTTNNQGFPAVAMDANGDFVVTWLGPGQDGSSWGIAAQRYNSAGEPQGAEFWVDTYNINYTLAHHGVPTVAMDADGNFVVAWQDGVSSTPDDPDPGYDIYARRYNSDGVPYGGKFRVNTDTWFDQGFPAVAMNAGGGFVVAWQDSVLSGGSNIYAQRYNSSGVVQGGEFRVTTNIKNKKGFPAVAMDADGNFVVAWDSVGQDGDHGGIYAQRYNSAGEPQGDEFRVNTYTTNWQRIPTVAMDADGDFVVVWSSYGQDGSDWDIYAQRYGSGRKVVGLAVGLDFGFEEVLGVPLYDIQGHKNAQQVAEAFRQFPGVHFEWVGIDAKEPRIKDRLKNLISSTKA